MKENRLRKLLDAGKPTIGTRLQQVSPAVVEAVGNTGMFDYVEFLAEYAPFDMQALDNFCRAAELYDMSSMIKVDREPRRFLAQRAIGSGFQSVLFADCYSAEEARECVRIVRPETPQDGGAYGAALRRFAYTYAGGPESYSTCGGSAAYADVLRDVVVAVMIEKRSAVDNLAEILSVQGVDMIQWGPADYAMSIGKPGARSDPQVKEAERYVIKTALDMGVVPRVEIGSVEQAACYLDMGVRHFSIGVDLMILFKWLKEKGENLRHVMENGGEKE